AEALTAFLHAIEANPRNPEAYRWASVVYADRGDLANEYRMSRAAYEFEPKDPAYALPLAGVLAERLGDYRGALEIMTGVLASGMETPALLDRIGYLHGLLGQIDDAIRFYQRAAALDPRDPTHLRGLGWVLSVQGHEEEAIQALQHALTLNPWVSETRYQLAIVYRKAGHYDEAIPEYERVYREEPSRRTYLPDLCITYHLAARFESARECAVQYLRMAPTSPDMQFLRSFSLAGALDRAPRALWHAEVVDVGGRTVSVGVPLIYSWVSVRTSAGDGGRLLKLVLGPDEQRKFWGGESVVLTIGPGRFGVPWVVAFDRDEEVYCRRLLESLPNAVHPWHDLVQFLFDHGRL